jgi:hypothetical protein
MFTFIQYGTYDICPGPVFRWEFNGGVYFMIRLTIFGNFMYAYASYTTFWCEFSRDSDYVIRRLHFENI